MILKNLLDDGSGATAVEYSVVVAVVLGISVSALSLVAQAIDVLWQLALNALANMG